MFGSSANTTPAFGSSTNTGAFGGSSNTNAFGASSSPFGQSTSNPFAAPSPSPFGAAPAASQPTTFGGFGSSNFSAAQPTSAFGSSAPSAFGSTSAQAPSSGFSGFQGTSFTSSPFNAAPAPSGGLFSSSAPASSTFGAPAAAPSQGLFGSSPAPVFGGAPAPSSSPFASSASGTTSAFSFGSSSAAAPAPSGGLFGAPQPATAAAPGAGQGTRAVPYQMTRKQDGSTTMNLMSLTAQPQYEQKSFEELRVEDYAAGNKGSAGAAPTPTTGGFGGFGANAAAPSTGFGFGSSSTTPAPAFGAPSSTSTGGGLFGSPAPASGTGLFGGGGGNTFGATSTAPSSSFGAFGSSSNAPTPAPFSFGATPAPAPSTGLFGAPAAPTGGSLFGSSAPAPSGGLFGAPANAPAPSSTGFSFGKPAPAPGGLFGNNSAQAPSGGSLFNAPAPAQGTNLFGATASAPSSGGLFGTTSGASGNTGNSLFGSSPAPGQNLFGAPAPAPGGLFSSAPSSGGFGFGSSPAPAAGGIFSSSAAAPSTGGFGFGGGFGSSAAAPAPGGGLFNSAPAPAPSGLFGAQPPATASPFGGSTFGGGGLFGQTAPQPNAAAQAPPTYPSFGGMQPPAMTPPAAPINADARLAQMLAVVEGQRKDLELSSAWKIKGGSPLQAISLSPSGQYTSVPLSERAAEGNAWTDSSSPSGSCTNFVIPSLNRTYSDGKPIPRGLFGSRGSASTSTLSEAKQQLLSQGKSDRASSATYSSSSHSPSAYAGSSTKRLEIQPEALSRARSRAINKPILPKGFTSPQPSTVPAIRNSTTSTPPTSAAPSKTAEKTAAADISYDDNGGDNGLHVETNSTQRHAYKDAGAEERKEEQTGLKKHDSSDGDIIVENGDSFLPGSSSPVRTPTSANHTPVTADRRRSSPSSSPAEDDAKSAYSASYEIYKRAIAPQGSKNGSSTPGSNSKTPQGIRFADKSKVMNGVGRSHVSPSSSDSSQVTPKLTKDGYVVSPSIEELEQMSEVELATVANFVVSRPGYGRIEWEGEVDVRNVDLDAMVVIEDKEVSVYHDLELTGTKPPEGSKLNRPAIITLEHVFPKEGASASSENMRKFEKRVKKITARNGSDFISYDPYEGTWKFKVHHFSTYGFTDDEDSDDDSDDGIEDVTPMKQKRPVPSTRSTPGVKVQGTARQNNLALHPGNSGRRGDWSAIAMKGTPVSSSSRTKKESATKFIGSPSPSKFSAADIYEMSDNSSGTDSERDEEEKKWEGEAKKLMRKHTSKKQARFEAESSYNIIAAYVEEKDDDIDEMDENGDSNMSSLATHIKSVLTGAADDYDNDDDDEQQGFDEETSFGLDSLNKAKELRMKQVINVMEELSNGIENGGICHYMQSEVSANSKNRGLVVPSSSSIDFSSRLGKSFRPSWRRDNGRVLRTGMITRELVHSDKLFFDKFHVGASIPQLQDHGSTNSTTSSLPNNKETSTAVLIDFLQVHRNHSVQCGVMEDDCPVYELPRSMNVNGGSRESYGALCKALSAYASKSASTTMNTKVYHNNRNNADPEVGLIAHRAFALLLALYGQEEEQGGANILPLRDAIPSRSNNVAVWTSAHRRREGIKKWLRDACESDMNVQIQSCMARGDVSGAIMAALAGGDFDQAIRIATEEGWLRFATLLSAVCFHHDPYQLMDQQKILWERTRFLEKMPPPMQRVYTLLSGDLDLEVSLFQGRDQLPYDLDWRQRLSLHLWVSDKGTTVEDAVMEYDGEVEATSVPFPVPRYAAYNFGRNATKDDETTLSRTKGKECILYQLLKMWSGLEHVTLKDVVSPLGYNSNEHNYTLSFHLVSLLHSIGSLPPLPVLDWTRLKDSLCSQLILEGQWHWAVYVWLCAGADGKGERTSIQAAKELVLRHFSSPDTSDDMKQFLINDIKIPVKWTVEALTNRAGYDGNFLEHMTGLMTLGRFDDAARATQTNLIPFALVIGGEKETMLARMLTQMEEQYVTGIKEAGGEEYEIALSQWNQMNGCGPVLEYLNFMLGAFQRLACPPGKEVPVEPDVNSLLSIAQDLNDQLSLDGLANPTTPYHACQNKQMSVPHQLEQVAILQAIQLRDVISRRLEALASSQINARSNPALFLLDKKNMK